MSSNARLDRLRRLVAADLEALPDRPLSPSTVEDEAQEGGVLLTLSDNHSDAATFSASDCTLQPREEEDAIAPQKLVASLSHISLSTSSPAQPVENLERRFVLVEPESEPQPETQPVPQASPDRRFILVTNTTSTWNVDPYSTVASNQLPPINAKRGSLASHSQAFCPIIAISRFPYKFCNHSDSQKIATRFFDAQKFWQREWDLFYIWDVDEEKPLILVPEGQVQILLDSINREFPNVNAKITAQHRQDGLVVRFPHHPRCTPRYLGRSSSKSEYENMAFNAPTPKHTLPGEAIVSPPDERTLEAFKQKFEDALEQNKAKKRAQNAKRREQKIILQQNMGKQLKRAQRYLGLRPKKEEYYDPLRNPNPTLSWRDLQEPQLEPDTRMTAGPINPLLPAPYPCDSSVVFVCVDVESWERNHRQITEVGISSLDTRDLTYLPPGKDGENWLSKIYTRHFRLKEHGHLNNTEFVQGCANRFEHGGESEWISLSEAPQVVASCFRPPFCSPVPDTSLQNDWNGDGQEKRNIIFLGHDTGNDIAYLQQLGYNPLNLKNLLEPLDTAVMHRAWKRDPNPRSLGGILYDFDIAGWNLHNAGNDAFYTMQAMLAICVREATVRNTEEVKQKREEEKANRIMEATTEAAMKAKDDYDGWSSNDEGEDGGDPVPIAAKEDKTPQSGRTCPSNLPSNSSPTESAPAPSYAHAGGFAGGSLARYLGRLNARGRGRESTPTSAGRGHRDRDACGRGHGRGRGRGQDNRSGRGAFSSRGRYRGGRGSSKRGSETEWEIGTNGEEQGDLLDLS